MKNGVVCIGEKEQRQERKRKEEEEVNKKKRNAHKATKLSVLQTDDGQENTAYVNISNE